jgi:hypothetical protein
MRISTEARVSLCGWGLARSHRRACLRQASFPEDEVLALGALCAWTCALAGSRDICAWMDEDEGGKQSSAWDIISALVDLGYKEEEWVSVTFVTKHELTLLRGESDGRARPTFTRLAYHLDGS